MLPMLPLACRACQSGRRSLDIAKKAQGYEQWTYDFFLEGDYVIDAAYGGQVGIESNQNRVVVSSDSSTYVEIIMFV